MKTTGSSSDSLQLGLFLKWELLLKERICSQREYPFTGMPYKMSKAYTHPQKTNKAILNYKGVNSTEHKISTADKN